MGTFIKDFKTDIVVNHSKMTVDGHKVKLTEDAAMTAPADKAGLLEHIRHIESTVQPIHTNKKKVVKKVKK
jgi:hypothetical protein